MSTVTCIAPVNIAVIKYWGKRDEKLILPLNDSISTTLDMEQLCAKTTVMISPNFKNDCIWLNGKEEDFKNPRLQNCLSEVKKRAGHSNDLNQWKIHICSENNFPTAAGMASSAAGYACLVTALAKLYEVEGDISVIARLGSGSACRSTQGGFVRWHMGSEQNGSDSIVKQIAPASHWPEMRILILIVNDSKKKVSSAIGMKRTMETSELLKHRVKHVVPDTANKMQQAIIEKDFKTYAKLTMKDSNQLHALNLDTYPPNIYMNDISHAIVELVHLYNDAVDDVKVAYTFDAGPNATLYLLETEVPKFMGVLDYFFPPLENVSVEYKKGLPIDAVKPSEDLLNKINVLKRGTGCFKYIIHTRVGDGPKYLQDSKDHLLNSQGWPINHKYNI